MSDMILSGRRCLAVGLIGVGRLGRVYARDLATRIPETRLAAVADINRGAAQDVASEFAIPASYESPDALIDDPAVEAVVIVASTHAHHDIVIQSVRAGKPTFCEKPLALSLRECRDMQDAIEKSGTFFQMGFMRRFDPGYEAAKRQVDDGKIGRPVLFKSTSRDPFLPSLDYVKPSSSGGILVDMGIHDFDLARWFMGEVDSVSAIGGVLAYPELSAVGDIDNAVASLVFSDGRLGVIDLTRNGIYGYDIATEILGTEGTVRIGYLRETPITMLTKNSVTHDTVPYFMERFERAYTRQLQDFAQNVLNGRPPSVTLHDGIEALRIALAAGKSLESGGRVSVT
jgi:inositol 2-dehydrogenase